LQASDLVVHGGPPGPPDCPSPAAFAGLVAG
jgi:hypothetical protein